MKPERELELALRDGKAEDEGWRVRKDGSRFWAKVIISRGVILLADLTITCSTQGEACTIRSSEHYHS